MKQIWDCELLKKWQNLAQSQKVSDLDNQVITKFQRPLRKGGTAWNEAELESKFISPLIVYADTKSINNTLKNKIVYKILRTFIP